MLLPGGRLELMVKPRGATPTTLVSLLIDHIVAKASSTIFPYCMPIRFLEAIRSTIFMENRSYIFLTRLISVIRKQQGIILYIIHSLFVGWNIERIIVVSRKLDIFYRVLLLPPKNVFLALS